MAVNGTISQTAFTDKSAAADTTTKLLIKAVHINELRTAITALNNAKANVDNCGNCTACQTCQSNQANQKSVDQACQKSVNQSCQADQVCQYATLNQSCQTNQSCRNISYTNQSCRADQR